MAEEETLCIVPAILLLAYKPFGIFKSEIGLDIGKIEIRYLLLMVKETWNSDFVEEVGSFVNEFWIRLFFFGIKSKTIPSLT